MRENMGKQVAATVWKIDRRGTSVFTIKLSPVLKKMKGFGHLFGLLYFLT